MPINQQRPSHQSNSIGPELGQQWKCLRCRWTGDRSSLLNIPLPGDNGMCKQVCRQCGGENFIQLKPTSPTMEVDS